MTKTNAGYVTGISHHQKLLRPIFLQKEREIGRERRWPPRTRTSHGEETLGLSLKKPNFPLHCLRQDHFSEENQGLWAW